MILKTIFQKNGVILTLLGVICMTGCESPQTDNSSNRLSVVQSPTATVTPFDSPRRIENANKQSQSMNKQLEGLFAESTMLNIPECIAFESLNIARMREANFSDEEIRKEVFAWRNMIRMNESDPNKQAEACKKMFEMRQKTPYRHRPKK